MYASGFRRDASFAVKDILFEERVYLICSKVEAGEERFSPMRAGRLFKALHAFLGSAGDLMEKNVFVKAKLEGQYTTANRVVDRVDEVPCYKGRALCFITSPAR